MPRTTTALSYTYESNEHVIVLKCLNVSKTGRQAYNKSCKLQRNIFKNSMGGRKYKMPYYMVILKNRPPSSCTVQFHWTETFF